MVATARSFVGVSASCSSSMCYSRSAFSHPRYVTASRSPLPNSDPPIYLRTTRTTSLSHLLFGCSLFRLSSSFPLFLSCSLFETPTKSLSNIPSSHSASSSSIIKCAKNHLPHLRCLSSVIVSYPHPVLSHSSRPYPSSLHGHGFYDTSTCFACRRPCFPFRRRHVCVLYGFHLISCRAACSALQWITIMVERASVTNPKSQLTAGSRLPTTNRRTSCVRAPRWA
ncbi:hypothetical protein BC834DRAFT_195301 [Gloeopeniophorella convolvens]|nr:hypothetical protein BC834DRAFT_195301 [Gloeopeniophorella convolvens]